MSLSNADSNGSRSLTKRCRAKPPGSSHESKGRKLQMRPGGLVRNRDDRRCRRHACPLSACRRHRGEDRQFRLSAPTPCCEGRDHSDLDQRGRFAAHGCIEHQAVQVQGTRYRRPVLIHVHDAGCVRVFLFGSPAHDRGRRCRSGNRQHYGAMMLGQTRHQTVAQAAKPELTLVTGKDGSGLDRAQRFRDAALPYLDDVYTLARYLLRNKADAEDATQECYLRALRHFDTYRGPAMKPWLFAILRNICRSEFARRSGNLVNNDERAEPDEDAIPLWQEAQM